MMRSRGNFSEANNESIMDQLGRGLLQLMHIHIMRLLQRVENMYMYIWKNRHQYTNTCVFSATSEPSFSQDDALDLKLFFKKVYHEVYECFLKQESGNCSAERASDGAILVRIQNVISDPVCCIELG